MDLSKATDVTSFNQLNNVLEGIYRLGENSKVENGLASKTQVSKDGKTWTFTLRNSKWSDGTPLTAKDFVYSWRRTVNPKTASQYAYLFEGIHNADKISKGKAAVNTLGIKAEGNNKLVVSLDKRIPYFKLLMGFPLFFPQQEKAVEKYGSKYGTASKYMVYNGPFKQTGWTGSNLSWNLKKNNNYWDKNAVKLDTIHYSVQKTPSTAYNLYQSNKIDAVSLDAVHVHGLHIHDHIHFAGFQSNGAAGAFGDDLPDHVLDGGGAQIVLIKGFKLQLVAAGPDDKFVGACADGVLAKVVATVDQRLGHDGIGMLSQIEHQGCMGTFVLMRTVYSSTTSTDSMESLYRAPSVKVFA